jgi:hypothetical protein
MEIDIIPPRTESPPPYVHSLSMVIKSFKGRRNVQVHLFRAAWNPKDETALPWDTLLTDRLEGQADEPGRRVVMEAFTDDERDRIVNYLKEQYSTRLTAIRSTPLTFPVPAGLAGLSQADPGKGAGFIDFAKIPSYSLDIPLKGFYDLSGHLPIVEE